MRNRATTAGFVLSMVGAVYQMLAYPLAVLVYNATPFYVYTGLSELVIPSLVVLWACSHLFDGRTDQSIVWPSIILALGFFGLASIILEWLTPTPQTFPSVLPPNQTNISLTVISAPMLVIIGGILSFIGLRRQPQQSSSTDVPART